LKLTLSAMTMEAKNVGYPTKPTTNHRNILLGNRSLSKLEGQILPVFCRAPKQRPLVRLKCHRGMNYKISVGKHTSTDRGLPAGGIRGTEKRTKEAKHLRPRCGFYEGKYPWYKSRGKAVILLGGLSRKGLQMRIE